MHEHPSTHFVLRMRVQTPGTTLDPSLLIHGLGIKLKGLSSFTEQLTTVCYMHTDGRYRASDILRRLLGGRRRSKRNTAGIFYNALVDDPGRHIVGEIEVDAADSQRFADERDGSKAGFECVGQWARPLTYRELLMRAIAKKE